MKVNPKVQEIIDKYPNLFRGVPRCGFYVGKGWLPLIETLCVILNHHIPELPVELRHEVFVTQVKQKFGGLRFYVNKSTPYMDGAIALAETMSYNICEQCGKPAVKGRPANYIRTLCAKHHRELNVK